jgi:hypothetical protein
MRKGILAALALLALAVFIVAPGIAESAGFKQKKVIIKNMQKTKAEVNINFSDISEINKSTLGGLCDKRGTASNLNCGFDLGPNEQKEITNPFFKMLSMSLAFNKVVGCGSTKAELTVNYAKGDDNFDVSCVDGFNEKIAMIFTYGNAQQVKMGPPNGKTGNENVYGVFPYGCDICAGRLSPQKACGPYPLGNSGCKSGTEHNPSVICQYSLNHPNEDKGEITIYLLPKD